MLTPPRATRTLAFRMGKLLLIAAGRGRRLGPETDERPKCLVEVAGKTLLQHQLDAARAAGLEEVVLIRGWQGGRIPPDGVRFVENPRWESNNILGSLMCAEAEMDGGFVFAYSDILYRPEILARAARAPGDAAIVVDRDWKPRYEGRVGHPVQEAELASFEGDRLVRTGKGIGGDAAEFIGMGRFSAEGARRFRDLYHELKREPANPYPRARSFEQAYVTDHLQALADRGEAIRPVWIEGGWFEIDVPHDLAAARRAW